MVVRRAVPCRRAVLCRGVDELQVEGENRREHETLHATLSGCDWSLSVGLMLHAYWRSVAFPKSQKKVSLPVSS